MDTRPVKNPDPVALILAFLKTEAFYLVVLLMVVAAGAVQTYRSVYTPDEDLRPVLNMVDQKQLYHPDASAMRELARKHPNRALFADAVNLLDFGVFVAGLAAILLLVSAKFYRKESSDIAPPIEPPSTPPWTLWDVLKVAAAFAAGSMLFRAILGHGPIESFMTPQEWLAEIFARVLLIGVLLHVAVVERHAGLAELGIRPGVGRPILLGLFVFFVIQPFLALIEAAEFRWMEQMPLQTPLQGMLQTDSSFTLILSVFVAVVLAPLSEELLFRAFLQPVLQKWVGPTFGIVLSAAFFAVAHMDLFVLPIMFVLGLGLGYAYHRTRSLAAPVALHSAYNALGILSLFSVRAIYAP